ncbi:MAG: GH3 auxin-responsive promoter family protein [Myxococcota bacterium]
MTALQPLQQGRDVEDVVGRGLTLLFRGALALIRQLPDNTLRAGARALFSKSWRTFEEASADPQAAQEARLQQILARNAQTAFGREHGFSSITSLEQLAEKVPVRTWTEFAPYARRMVEGEKDVLCAEEVFYFARSSGTTGEPKNIPVTASYIDEFRHGRRVWMRQVAQVMPAGIKGHLLTVHSPNIEGYTPSGVPYGSITVAMGSGREDATGYDPVPRDVFRLSNYSARYYLALRFALEKPISVWAAVNPSTLVLLAQVLTRHASELARDVESGTLWDGLALTPDERTRFSARLGRNRDAAKRLLDSVQKHGVARPVDIWPSLCGVLCWKGGSAPFYLEQIQKLMPGLPIMDYGYVASEGCFTTPLDAGDAQGVALAAGHVLEFIPVDAYEAGSRATVPLWKLEQGGRYVVVITGSHGLTRYDMQDVVEVRGFHHKAPLLAFLHKSGNMVSITGEKVGESHVVDAVTAACQGLGLTLRGFCVAPELTNPPRYVFAVESQPPLAPEVREKLLRACDEALCNVNIEYRAKRESLRLGEPVLRELPPGAFERHRARRVAAGAPDAHVKPPHLGRTLALVEELGRTENA